MSICAPARRRPGDWTCFELAELQSMVQAWNISKLGHPIHIRNPRDKRELWSALQQVFFPMCGDNEACWLDNRAFMKALEQVSPELYHAVNYYSIKPKFEKGTHEWLSTTDIEYVMQQYEDVFPDFVFIGVFPSDHFKLYAEDFPYEAFTEYKSSAIVFNQDESHQGGSHWVCMFFTHPRGRVETIEHFDSTGDAPIRNLAQFMKHPFFSGAHVEISQFKHQRGDNECGMYCMFYILMRLHGNSFDDINSRRISDTEMNRYRRELFRMGNNRSRY